MGNDASAEEFGKDLGLIQEAVLTGRKVGANKEFWARIAHDQTFFERVIELFRMTTWQKIADSVGSNLSEGIFIDPKKQVERVKKLNEQYHMGFTEEDFVALGEPKVGWLGEMIMPVVFLEFFPRDGLLKNFSFLWNLISRAIYPTGFLHDFEISKEFLEPWKGAVFGRGLRWRAVDVGRIPKTQEAVQEIRLRTAPENLAHLGILCMAILFPEWTRNLGIKFPKVALPGIQAQKRNCAWNKSKYRQYEVGKLHYCYIPVLSNERSINYGKNGIYLEMFELLELEVQGFTAIPVFKNF